MKSMLRIFALALVAACGGAEPAPRTEAPVATASAPTATAPTSSAASPVAPHRAFVAAATHALPANAPKLADLDSPAGLAKKYGGATVSRAARLRTLTDLTHKWRDFAAMPRADRERAAVAWFSSRPEIEASGVSATGAWARFKDGKMIVVPMDTWSPPAPARHAERAVGTSSANAKADVPASKTIATPDWFGFPAHAKVNAWLGAHGYAGASPLPSVEWLRTGVKHAGVFYIDSHGGDGFERNVDIASRKGDGYDHLYAIMTSTPVRDASGKVITSNSTSGVMMNDRNTRTGPLPPSGEEKQIEDELASGELVYFFADAGDGNIEWHYGFTHRFVTKYFSFDDNAFVFLNACHSHGQSAVAMVEAFVDRGAALVTGWTNDVTPATAMRAVEFMFDRMLGANQMSDYGLHPDKPKQRPWSFANAYGDLQAHDYDHETTEKKEDCTLDYTGDTSVILVPIIDRMESDDVKKVLTLHGTFGDDPSDKARHVKIAGADCPVKDWSSDKITCDLGSDFKVGDVVVDKHGRKSNPSPLTGWNIHVRYNFDMNAKGHFGLGIGFEAHVRADVHAVRDTPADSPKPRDPVSFYVAADSKCASANDKGSYSANGGHAWMTGGSSIPLLEGPPMGLDWCVMYGQLEPQDKKLKLAIFALTAHKAGTLNATVGGFGRAYGFGLGVVPAPGLFDGPVPPPAGMQAPPLPTGIYLSLDDHGAVASGKRGPVNLHGNDKAKVSVEWDASTPTDYPTDDTPQ